jgi:predicted RecB family nuclease
LGRKGKHQRGPDNADEPAIRVEGDPKSVNNHTRPPNAREFLAQDPEIPPPDSPQILALRQIPLVGATRAQLFWKLGARNLGDLANMDESDFRDHPLVENFPDGSIVDAFALIQGFARAQANQEAVVLAPEPLFDHLVGPFVFFDLEFVAGQGEVFLWGLKHDQDPNVVQWFGHRRREQRDAIMKFKALIEEEDPLFVAYGSTASDEVAIREAAKRFGVEGRWLKEMRFLDLLQRVVFTESPETQRVYLPVRNLKCGTVAEFFGYAKPDHVDIKDGYQAFRLYQRYRRRPDEKIKDRLMRYNAEDLFQTEMIFHGMKELFKDA